MAKNQKPLAVTIGEPAGIGPDIILAAHAQRKRLRLPPFFVIGDAALLTRRAMELGIAVSTNALERGDIPSPFTTALPVISLGAAMLGVAGKPAIGDAPYIMEAIQIAIDMIYQGEASGLVTCPIAKNALYAAGFEYPGHTEYLATLADQHNHRQTHKPVMMIASDLLRTVPVTIHIPLESVPGALTTALIVQTGQIVARDLTKWFGITNPRLAISGLNPHAGENGAMGGQEIEIIMPAIKILQAENINATGPWPADTMFHESARQRYDAAICMYHDQALIPAKTLAFDKGVNVTLGLPFIRTSPDHGTAFDIAGSGEAKPDSFIAALHMASAMSHQEQQQ
jgi:4-hydroxythreonine-4-phosphate dehydrogenase